MHAPRRVHLAFLGAPPPPPQLPAAAAAAATKPPTARPGHSSGEQKKGSSSSEQKKGSSSSSSSSLDAEEAKPKPQSEKQNVPPSSSSGGNEGAGEVPCTVVGGNRRWRIVARVRFPSDADCSGRRGEGEDSGGSDDGTEADTGTGSLMGTWHTPFPPSNTAQPAAPAPTATATPLTPPTRSLTVPSVREHRSDAEVLRLLTVCAGNGAAHVDDGSGGHGDPASKRARRAFKDVGCEEYEGGDHHHEHHHHEQQQQQQQYHPQQQRQTAVERKRLQWIPRRPPMAVSAPSRASVSGAATGTAATQETTTAATKASAPSPWIGPMRLCHLRASLATTSLVVVVSRPPAPPRTVHTRDGRDALLSTLDIADETADDVALCLWDAWTRVAPTLRAGALLVLHAVHVRVYQGSLQLSPGRGSHILSIASADVASGINPQTGPAPAGGRLAELNAFTGLRARVCALAAWTKRVMPHLYRLDLPPTTMASAAASTSLGASSFHMDARLRSLSLFLRTYSTGRWQILCRIRNIRSANEADGVVYGCLRCGSVGCSREHAVSAPTSASQARAIACATCIDRGGSQDGFAHGWLLPALVLTVSDTDDNTKRARVRLSRTIATKVFLPQAQRATRRDADAAVTRIQSGAFGNTPIAVTCLPPSQHAGPRIPLAPEDDVVSSPRLLTAADAAILPFALPFSAQ